MYVCTANEKTIWTLDVRHQLNLHYCTHFDVWNQLMWSGGVSRWKVASSSISKGWRGSKSLREPGEPQAKFLYLMHGFKLQKKSRG